MSIYKRTENAAGGIPSNDAVQLARSGQRRAAESRARIDASRQRLAASSQHLVSCRQGPTGTQVPIREAGRLRHAS
jgi:hypothetical protein